MVNKTSINDTSGEPDCRTCAQKMSLTTLVMEAGAADFVSDLFNSLTAIGAGRS